jgi:asparagine synthase (glutamine-hydrolysing)
MCGITGLIAPRGASISGEQVHRMCQTIVHRGPDDEGIYARGPIGLGMRRLSIIDVAGGQQPIHNEDRTVWIVFNGEIYNFPELRDELAARGHQFYTHSDTEMIVHLYEEMGADCVTRLRGMFAFALYDERRQSLLLARDRLGKKPLHYALDNGYLYFGSEIKTILEAAPHLAEVDPAGIVQYFYHRYIPDPLTAYKKIAKLPPGCLAEYSNGEIKVRPYWELPAYGTHDPGSDEACLEELELRLAEATRIRLISEVPLGALLSGGVDSSIVVALMARASSSPVKTFSIGFGKQDFDETRYARMVAEKFDTEHHELFVEPDIADTLEHLTRMMEEPFGDSSMIPTYHVSRLARQHVTVALAGDGGDELFAGYNRYLVDLSREKFEAIPAPIGTLFRDHVYSHLPESMPGRRFLYNISLQPPDRYLDSVSFLSVLGREKPMFSSEFLECVRPFGDPLRPFRDIYAAAGTSDPLSRLLYLDTRTYLSGDILTKVDRMSMATSLEVRAPLLDHLLVEWVARLPIRYKYRDGQRKFMLKKLAERLGIPSELLHRCKRGFAMPLVHWMREDLKDTLLPILLEPRTLQRGYFKPEAVRSVMDEHHRGDRDRAGILWMLLVLELWHRNFLEARGYASTTDSSRCHSHAAEPVLASRGAR